MPRALIVTSSYAPTTIADMHRTRHLAWDLPAAGWDVEVLCPDQSFQRPEFTDPGAGWLFRADTPVHHAAAWAPSLFALAGMRSIGWRAFWPLLTAGTRLLATGRFDLVYISTAHFPLFCLGPQWRRRLGVPYVLDYHDPWIRPDAGRQTTSGGLKRRLANALSHSMERAAVTQASGFVSVSPVYLEELRSRYGALRALAPDRSAAIPFAGSPHDFAPGCDAGTPSTPRHIVYIGAGGAIMRRTFDAICAALAAVRRDTPALLEGLRIQLVGTDGGWQDGGPRPLQDLAASYGLGDLVREEPRRIAYSEAMTRVQRSDGLLVLGVDDAGYVPSKLFSYALTGLPLLAAFRSDSPATTFFDAAPELGHLLSVDARSTSHPEHVVVMRRFLSEVHAGRRRTPSPSLGPFLSPAMARRHASLFDTVVGTATGNGAS